MKNMEHEDINSLKEQFLKISRQNEEIAYILEEEKNHKKRLLDEANRQEQELEEKELYIKKLEENQSIQDQFLSEIQKKLAVERKERKTLEKERDLLFSRLEKIKESVEVLEGKNGRLRKKYEGEINKLAEEKSCEIEEKSAELAAAINSKKELEGKFLECLDLNSHLKRELEHLTKMKDMSERELENVKKDQGIYNEEIRFLKREIDNLRHGKEELYQDLKRESDKADNLAKENSLLNKTLNLLEEEKTALHKNNKKNLETIHELELNSRELNEQLIAHKSYISNLESKLDYLQSQQIQEFDKLERKVEEFLNEIKTVRDENTILRRSEDNLKRELDILERENSRTAEDNAKLKEKNKELKHSFREFDTVVRELIKDKKQDLKSYQRGGEESSEARYRSNMREKIKLLDNLKSNLRSERTGVFPSSTKSRRYTQNTDSDEY